ncbi:MAG: class I SAM-dependent methyltransferase [Caldilineaceae bacterium]
MNWSARLYLWACERLYHELAWGYDLVSWLVSLGHWNRWRGAAGQYLVDADGRLRQNVLEIGFGTGELLAQLTQAAADSSAARNCEPQTAPNIIAGLELSPAMHKVASTKLRRRQIAAPRVQAFAQQMPFADGVFDAVISTFPAPYIFDPQTLQECARVLRPAHAADKQPGGQLLIVGMWVALNVGWLRRLGLPFYGRPHPAWRTQVAERLAQAGFTATFVEVQDGAFTVSVIRGQKRA